VTISPFEKGADALAGAPILAVEDERDLAEEIRLELQASGHQARLSETVDDALREARAGAAVLVIGEDGPRSSKRCAAKATPRRRWLISALSSVDERINGLKAGGDDYLV
jgi:two-component system OmpR family response regulator